MTPSTEERLVAVLERHSALLEKLERKLDAPLGATRRLATAEEAEELLGVKRTRLHSLIKAGKIVRVLDGLKMRVDVQSIERYLAERLDPPKNKGGRPRKNGAQAEAARISKLKP
jgi:hypothetical protein